jgi:choline kinase
MEALILAAGAGSRLGVDVPKCLVEVGGRPLLSHQLDTLEAVGAETVTIVVGYQRDRVADVAGDRARLVVNDAYDTTNSLYSFWLARHAVADDLLLLNSDVLFPTELVRRLLRVRGSALAYDSSSGDEAEHMKVRLRWGRLQRMSKELEPVETAGENVGVIRLAPADAEAAFAAASWLIEEGCRTEWVGAAISDAARECSISCLDVADLPWVEIDFPDDLSSARDEIWPAISARESQPRRPSEVTVRAGATVSLPEREATR